MKKRHAAVVLGGWLLSAGFSGQPAAAASVQALKTSSSSRPPAGAVATHATTGVVRTVSQTIVVVTRHVGGKKTESSFILTPATQRAGNISAGSTVEIRYRTEGRQKIATAITVEARRQ